MNANKPPRTYPEQLQILKSRGLGVTDESEALHILEHHNYYRLSIDWLKSLLVHMRLIIEPKTHWPHRLVRHLLTLDPNLIPHMGFPEDWRTRTLWQNLFLGDGKP